MADLTISEKYPNSWRADHPTFGDVRKTTYSKGIITEFQKLQDDPIKVAPMVKVQVDDQESDFIPIFFHARPQYWDDDEGVLATDYNEGGKYFEKAWMSFRGDDEVIVMLREGEPVMVMGFADGVPRLGENIFKSEVGNQYWWDCEKIDEYPDDNGPDDNPLKLLTPCERIFVKEESITFEGQFTQLIYREGYFKVTDVKTVHTEGIPGWTYPADHLEALLWKWLRGTYQVRIEKDITTTYRYLMPVGAILYLLETISVQTIFTYETKSFDNLDGGWSPNPGALMSGNIVIYVDPADYSPPYSGPSPVYYPAVEEAFYNMIASYQGQIYPEQGPTPQESYELNSTRTYQNSDEDVIGVHAAPYTKELYDRAKAGDDIPSEFAKQTDFSYYFLWYEFCSEVWGINKPDLEMFVRPHTQDELKEAGLWPS
jgi:hypothetical protein